MAMSTALVSAADGDGSGSGASSAFGGGGLCVPDVLGLMQEKAREEQDEAQVTGDKDRTPKKEGEGAADDDDEEDDRATVVSEKAPPPDKSRRRWFDKARSQNAVKRQASLVLDKKVHEGRAVQEMLQKEIASVQELPAEDQHNYTAEVAIAEGRLKFLVACLSDKEEDLAALVREAFAGAISAPSSDYEKLKCCQALQSWTQQRVETIVDERSLGAVKEEVATAREPFLLLVAAAKQAGRDIANAKMARQKAQQQKRKLDVAARAAVPEAPPAKRHQGARASSRPLFTFEVSDVKKVPVHPGDADPANVAFDFSAPFIVTAPGGTPTPCPVPEVEPELESFQMMWVGSPERLRHGRGSVSISDRHVQQKVADFLGGLCRLQPVPEELAATAGLSDAVQQALRPGIFAAKEGEVVFNEQEWMACVRFQVCGTRQVILTPGLSLAASLPGDAEAEVAQPPAKTVPFKRRLWGLLFNMNLPAYKAFAAQHPVYCCTVGPRDLLYVPAGYVLAENIAAATTSADVLGFRMSVVAPGHQGGLQALEELAKRSGLPCPMGLPAGLRALADLMRKPRDAAAGEESKTDHVVVESKTDHVAAAGGGAAAEAAVAEATGAPAAAARAAAAPQAEGTPTVAPTPKTASAATTARGVEKSSNSAPPATPPPAKPAPGLRQPGFTEGELQQSLKSLADEAAAAAKASAAAASSSAAAGGKKPTKDNKDARKTK